MHGPANFAVYPFIRRRSRPSIRRRSRPSIRRRSRPSIRRRSRPCSGAGAVGHARPVLALCCAGSRCRPVRPCPRRGKSCRPHPPPTPRSSMAWHAPPRTLFFTRSTHFVKPHTQSTPLPKQNAPPSHYYKILKILLSNATHLHISAVYVYSCRHAEPSRQL